MCRDWPSQADPERRITTLSDTVTAANAEKQCSYSTLKIDLRSSKSWVSRASFGGQNDRVFTIIATSGKSRKTVIKTQKRLREISDLRYR